MVALGQTITIVNQSGKVVKTSKHLVDVWKEARSAYDAKKAEIKASRRDEQEDKDNERRARRQLEALQLQEDGATRSDSRRSSRGKPGGDKQVRRKPVLHTRTERPSVERDYSDSFYADELRISRQQHKPSPLRRDSHQSWRDAEPQGGELARRHTTDLVPRHHHPSMPARSQSVEVVDMDLAYGELPPPLPERKYETEVELRSKIGGLQRLLDECNCLQHSVTAIIDNLQKNPDALAAVALTLGEISNLASKLAPGALASIKTSFPAIIALLASPEFAIAVGVGVGITVIAFGGYKIVKKIKAKKEVRMLEDGQAFPALPEPESPVNEMDELLEIDRIENWRRGIVEAEADSLGTSVEGEFITPVATRTLIEEGRLTEADLKSVTSKKDKKHRKKSKSESGSKSGKSKATTKTRSKKESSGLRMLFKSHS